MNVRNILYFRMKSDELLNACLQREILQKCLEKCIDALEPVLIVECILSLFKEF